MQDWRAVESEANFSEESRFPPCFKAPIENGANTARTAEGCDFPYFPFQFLRQPTARPYEALFSFHHHLKLIPHDLELHQSHFPNPRRVHPRARLMCRALDSAPRFQQMPRSWDRLRPAWRVDSLTCRFPAEPPEGFRPPRRRLFLRAWDRTRIQQERGSDFTQYGL